MSTNELHLKLVDGYALTSGALFDFVTTPVKIRATSMVSVTAKFSGTGTPAGTLKLQTTDEADDPMQTSAGTAYMRPGVAGDGGTVALPHRSGRGFG